MSNLPAWMKEDNHVLYFNAESPAECIYYIPQQYFDSKRAEIIGEYVNTMGVFEYVYVDISGKAHDAKPFKCPTMIKCKPSKIERVNNFHLLNTQGPDDYRVLRFSKDSELISELNIPKNVTNVESFVKLVIGGHLPNYIPYDEILDYLLLNSEMNGFNYKITNQILALLVSELYRDKNDPSKPFRLSKSEDRRAYTAMPITQIPRLVSVYTSLTGEYPAQAIAAAITNKGDTPHSPLEKIIMN